MNTQKAMNFFLIACFLISTCLTSTAEVPKSNPWRCHYGSRPMKLPRGRPPHSSRPHSAQVDQQLFIPYKILYLIDDGIDEEDRAKLQMATEYVNEKLSKSIKARKLSDVRYQNPDPGCGELCEHMPFPDEFVLPCGTTGEPSEEIKQLNEANYTLVVRVLVQNQGAIANTEVDCTEDVLGFARSCDFFGSEVEQGPHHGYFVCCDKPSSKTDDDMRLLVLHETLHILMPYSLGGDGANNRNCHDCKDITWKEVKRQAMNEHEQPVEITIGMAIGPFIQKAAKDHFGCETAEGLELTFDIVDTSTMKIKLDQSHWAQYLFPDEILAPSHGTGRFSNLTLSALASHEKWYKVDQSQAEPLAYSKPSEEFACDVAHKSCFEFLGAQRGDAVKFMRPYCDYREGSDPNRIITSHCSPDHQRQLSCINHRSDTRCPFLTGTANDMYDNEACAKATSVIPDSLASNVGASFGPGTICVTTTSFPPWQEDKTNALCLHHECQMDTLIIKPNINNDPRCYITCTKSQSNQLLTVNWCSSSTTHRVSIICPDYEQVCKKETTTLATTSIIRTTTTTTPSSTTTSSTATSTTTSTTTTTVPATTPTESRVTTAATPATTKITITTTTGSSATTQKTIPDTTATTSRSSEGATPGRETPTPTDPSTTTTAQASSRQVSVSKHSSTSVTATASVDDILVGITLVQVAAYGL